MHGANLILGGALLSLVATTALFIVLYRRRRARAGTGLVILGNLLVLVVLGLALICSAEIYYRFISDTTDAYHLSLVSNRWAKRHYRMNNFGVRDDVDYVNRISPGKTRVTVIGDSFAAGHGVPRVEDRFVNRLRRDHPEWEIQILATDGMNTGPLTDRLREKLASGYETDVVLYAYVPNDITDLITELDAATRRLYTEKIGYLFRHSYFLNTYYYRFRISGDPELARYWDLLLAAHSGPRWERHTAGLTELQALVDRSGAELMVVTFPFFEKLDDPQFVALHEQLDRFWRDRGTPHLNLPESYRGMNVDDLMVNRYDSHPNEQAHEIAATALGDFLGRHIDAKAPLPAPVNP